MLLLNGKEEYNAYVVIKTTMIAMNKMRVQYIIEKMEKLEIRGYENGNV